MRELALGILRAAQDRSVHLRYRLFYARPEHVWIASYPRSGNTWLRFLLYDVLVGPSDDPHRLRRTIPDLHRGLSAVRSMPARFIKTHYPYRSAYRKVVYLVRDPRCAIASAYERHLQGGGARDNLTLEEFVRREIEGRGPYGSWDRHVRSYFDSGLDGNHLLVVRYERMLEDPAGFLEHILEFSGISAPRQLVRLVAEAHLDRMLARRGVEPEGSYHHRARKLAEVQSRRGYDQLPAPLRQAIAGSEIGRLAAEMDLDDGFDMPGAGGAP